MTDSTNTPDNSAADTWDGHSVIAVTFEDDSKAYRALTVLEELDSQRRISVREAIVAARDEDGKMITKDGADSTDLPGTAGGGMLGLLVGIIGGPLGMLIGGTYGLLVGSLFDLYDAEESDSALGAISSSVKPGHTALLAVVDEPSKEIVDTAMAAVGGTVVRRPVLEVEAEIAAAEEAQRKAKREAHKELMQAHRERDKAAVEAKVDKLKAKLHHGQKADDAAVPAGSAG